MKRGSVLTSLLFFTSALAFANIEVKIDTNSARTASKDMYGIFFEEINRAGAGGIEANMISNGSFEDAGNQFFSKKLFESLSESEREDLQKIPLDWNVDNPQAMEIEILRKGGMNEKNPSFLRLMSKDFSKSPSLISKGFEGRMIGYRERLDLEILKSWLKKDRSSFKNGGINIVKGDKYEFNLNARSPKKMSFKVSLVSQNGEILAEEILKIDSKTWRNYSLRLIAKNSDPYSELKITPLNNGVSDFDNITLYPQKRWRGTNLRLDLMQRIADLNPAFVRFPGGCYVEGNNMFSHTRWEDTIGDKSERKSTFAHWGYSSDNLLGFHEFLEMCEKLNAAPLYVVNCGMSHDEDKTGTEIMPMDKLQPLVQSALDAIEYANGAVDTKWGKLRAKNGHPKPFNLKYIEVGNENGGARYAERYDVFYKAIKEKYPQIKIVACDWGGTKFGSKLEIFDSHHYGTTGSFLNMVHRYDDHERGNYDVYFGEYAVTDGQGNGNMTAAVAEAAFMTGLERNSDLVTMTSFAPLLRRKDWAAWRQSAILFDGSRVCPTPSYFVQRMFGQNPIVKSFKSQVLGTSETLELNGPVGFGSWNTQIEVKDVKVEINGENVLPKNAMENMRAWSGVKGKWRIENNSLFQDSDATPATIFIGKKTWKNYTIEAKLRKISGKEGFLVYFSNRGNFWNLGGWNNSRSMIEGRANMQSRPITIATDKFYDVKIETKNGITKFYLDGELIEELEEPKVPYVSVSSGMAENGDVVIKVTNFYNEKRDVDFEISGLKGELNGFIETMYSENPLDENSLDEPEKIVPKRESISLKLPKFKLALKPNSVTIIRGKLK